MEKETTKPSPERPRIAEFKELAAFLQAMLEFRKANERGFSVLKATSALRRVSPSLVSLIVKGERKITLDRADELAKLMNLNSEEKFYFKNWLLREQLAEVNPIDSKVLRPAQESTTHILKDWLNVYVKDCFQIPSIQKNPKLIYQCLGSYASPQRIDRAIDFLIREGHLKRNLQGHIFIETHLAVPNQKVPTHRIRKFHKSALDIAKLAIEVFPPQERFANTLTLPLNEKSYEQLTEILQEFAQRLQEFAATNKEEGDRLYQIILNLSPTGGKLE